VSEEPAAKEAVNEEPAPRRRFFARARARARGLTPVANILESAMVMGWFVALIVGEKGMSQAAAARRSVEDGADESASRTSASDCQPQTPSTTQAAINPSTFTTPKPNAEAAISAIAGLGLGGERTYPYYLLPMQNVRATGQQEESIRIDPRKKVDEAHTFSAGRSMGCVEKPLDTPMGTLDSYRMKIWLTHFMGYK
jgi:hypothetical protein